MARITIADFISESEFNVLAYRDLYHDFCFVREMNTQMAQKYQELMDAFPLSQELEELIKAIEADVIRYSEDDNEQKKRKSLRLLNMRKFLSAIKALEAQDVLVMPESYDKLDPDLVY